MRTVLTKIQKWITKDGCQGIAEKRASRRREIREWASWGLALGGVISPWLIYWISGGK